MKLTVEAAPGELENRLEDAVHTLEAIAGRPVHHEGCECGCGDHGPDLSKGLKPEKDLAPLFPVLRHLLSGAQRRRDQIRQRLEAKITAVLEEAERGAERMAAER